MTALRLVLVLLVACGGSEPSVEEYSEAVVLNRNRADFVLGRIVRAQSIEEVLNRMDEASVVISKAAGELEDTGAPSDFQPEADDLVTALRQLSVDVQATADQARIPGFESLLTDTNAISFDSWDDVNKALAGLAGKGIDVSILQNKSAE